MGQALRLGARTDAGERSVITLNATGCFRLFGKEGKEIFADVGPILSQIDRTDADKSAFAVVVRSRGCCAGRWIEEHAFDLVERGLGQVVHIRGNLIEVLRDELVLTVTVLERISVILAVDNDG